MAMVYDLDKAEAELRAGIAVTRALPNLGEHNRLQLTPEAEEVHVAFMRWSVTNVDSPGQLAASIALICSLIKGMAGSYGAAMPEVEAAVVKGIVGYMSEDGNFVKTGAVQMTKRDVGDA